MIKLLKNIVYILLFISVVWMNTVLPSFSASNKLKFAQVSDIHYSLDKKSTAYKLLEETKPLLEDAISQINSDKNIEFVMITGDAINEPRKYFLDNFLEDIKKLNKPWYFLFGNHDSTTIEDIKRKSSHGNDLLTKEQFLKILKEKNSNYNSNISYYTFKPRAGIRVIVLDGAIGMRNTQGFLPEAELNWLDNILNKSKNDVVLVFIHFPLLPPFDSESHEIKNAKEFSSVLKKYKMPIAIFSGHYHAAKITKMGNILHVSTPALCGYPNAFRIVEIENKANKVIFKIELKETNLKELQTKSKIGLMGGTIFYGRAQDRTTEIEIEKKK